MNIQMLGASIPSYDKDDKTEVEGKKELTGPDLMKRFKK